MEQELLIMPEHLSFLMRTCCSILIVLCRVLSITVCPFSCDHCNFVLSRSTSCAYPLVICKRFYFHLRNDVHDFLYRWECDGRKEKLLFDLSCTKYMFKKKLWFDKYRLLPFILTDFWKGYKVCIHMIYCL